LNGRTPLATPDFGMEYSRAPKEGQAMTSLDLGLTKLAANEISLNKTYKVTRDINLAQEILKGEKL
jgi:hypothetical protein